MNRSSMCARAGLVALSLVVAACSRPVKPVEPPKVTKQKHEVKITLKETAPGHRTSVAEPETIVIDHYDPAVAGAHAVVWNYTHKSAGVHIDDPAVTTQPVCFSDTKRCTWDVPTGLLKPDEKTKKLKYTITGKNDDDTDLDAADPFIEVDR